MKKILSLIMALVMVLAMANFASAEQGDTVIVGIPADPGNINPFQGMSVGRIGILFSTYEFLVTKVGQDYPGVLMKGLTQVDDLTYDVEIYDYIHDQDNNHVTANDVKFCYDYCKEQGNQPKLEAIESIEVLSDYVARFHFDHLDSGDLYTLLMTCPIVTQAAFEASEDQMATDPVSTSPYRVVKYQTGSTIVMEYTGNYWQTDESLVQLTSKHNVNQIVFSVIPDAMQMSNALKANEIDITASVDASYVKDFMDVENYQVVPIPDNNTKYLIFNSHVFSDVNLRKAFAYAIDTEEIAQFAYDGVALLAKTIGNYKYPDYVDSWNDEEYYEYDPEKAAEYFKAAGVTGGTYRLMYNIGDQPSAIPTTIQSDLLQFGINIELVPYENALFGTYKAASDSGEWDLMLDQGGSPSLLTNVWKLSMDRREQVHGTTIGYVDDDQLQSLLEAAISDNSPENMDAFHQYLKEQCYEYGLVAAVNNMVHTSKVKTAVTCYRGQILPGACEY
ncbi:MAG: ABC transporter substrate-binding protein [Clostridia bacterium]|nr:ABC transporter substrate-binding protein [Clostridia bacterium]